MKLAVFRAKYADQYFLIDTEEDWYRVCMQVFRQRDDTEYSWYPQEPPTEPDIEEPEKPDPMPDWAEDEYKRELSRYNGRMKRYEREKHQWDLLERAREGDLHAANELIELRKDGEYEGYDIEELSDVHESVPYWAHSEQEQLDRCEEALDRIIQTEGDAEALENAREAVSSCAEQSDSPSTGESRGFHQRSARKLARYNVRRVLELFDEDDKEEALAVAERVRNRLEGWKESR